MLTIAKQINLDQAVSQATQNTDVKHKLLKCIPENAHKLLKCPGAEHLNFQARNPNNDPKHKEFASRMSLQVKTKGGTVSSR